jgi:hypothetical protein
VRGEQVRARRPDPAGRAGDDPDPAAQPLVNHALGLLGAHAQSMIIRSPEYRPPRPNAARTSFRLPATRHCRLTAVSGAITPKLQTKPTSPLRLVLAALFVLPRTMVDTSAQLAGLFFWAFSTDLAFEALTKVAAGWASGPSIS